MNESEFIEKNRGQWEELENLIESKVRDPDKLEELFIKVSSDLSYARTFYPNRSIRLYLNNLTQQVLDLIQSRKNKLSFSIFKEYYSSTLPKELWRARYAFLVSLIVFTVAVGIGALSTAYDIEFTRVILGHEYVEMTNENINDGDPMAVYKSSSQTDMFWAITLNNVRVALIAFVLGLFGSVGTVIILLSNGIMLGTFQYFFYKKGLFLTSFLSIWIHGTIEISAIIIAGGAGIILGDGILTPKTHSRSLSLQVASKRAIRVLLSTVPLFIIAGFLESYVTRLTNSPSIVKVAIILLSLSFIIYHYVLYPYFYQLRNTIENDDYEVQPSQIEQSQLRVKKHLSFGAICEITLTQFRIWIGPIIKSGILPIITITSIFYWAWAKYGELLQKDYSYLILNYSFFDFSIGGWEMFILYALCIVHIVVIIMMVTHNENFSFIKYMRTIKRHGLSILLLTLPYLTVFYFFSIQFFFICLLIFPPQIVISALHSSFVQNQSNSQAIINSFKVSYKRYFDYVGPFLFIGFLYYMIILLSHTLTQVLFVDFLTWHNFFPGPINNTYYIQSLIAIAFSCFALALYYFMYINQHESLECKEDSKDLLERIETLNLSLANED